jgi:hypothetical protein
MYSEHNRYEYDGSNVPPYLPLLLPPACRRVPEFRFLSANSLTRAYELNVFVDPSESLSMSTFSTATRAVSLGISKEHRPTRPPSTAGGNSGNGNGNGMSGSGGSGTYTPRTGRLSARGGGVGGDGTNSSRVRSTSAHRRLSAAASAATTPLSPWSPAALPAPISPRGSISGNAAGAHYTGSAVWSNTSLSHLWLTDIFRTLASTMRRSIDSSVPEDAPKNISWSQLRKISLRWDEAVEQMAEDELVTFQTESEPTSAHIILRWIAEQPLQLTLELLADAAVSQRQLELRQAAAASVSTPLNAPPALPAYAAPLAHRHTWTLLSALFDTLPHCPPTPGSPTRVRLDVLLAGLRDWVGVDPKNAPLGLLDLAEARIIDERVGETGIKTGSANSSDNKTETSASVSRGELGLDELYLWWSLWGSFDFRARCAYRGDRIQGTGSYGYFLYLYHFQHRLLLEQQGLTNSLVPPQQPLPSPQAAKNAQLMAPFDPTTTATALSITSAAASSVDASPLGLITLQTFLKVFAYFHPAQPGFQRAAESAFKRKIGLPAEKVLGTTVTDRAAAAAEKASKEKAAAAATQVAAFASWGLPVPPALAEAAAPIHEPAPQPVLKGLSWTEIIQLLLSKAMPDIYRKGAIIYRPPNGVGAGKACESGNVSGGGSGSGTAGHGPLPGSPLSNGDGTATADDLAVLFTSGVVGGNPLFDNLDWAVRLTEDDASYARALVTAAAAAHESHLRPFMRAHTPELNKQKQREKEYASIRENGVDSTHATSKPLGEDSSLDFDALLSAELPAGHPLPESVSPVQLLRALHTLRFVSHFFLRKVHLQHSSSISDGAAPLCSTTAFSISSNASSLPPASELQMSLLEFTQDFLAGIASRDRIRQKTKQSERVKQHSSAHTRAAAAARRAAKQALEEKEQGISIVRHSRSRSRTARELRNGGTNSPSRFSATAPTAGIAYTAITAISTAPHVDGSPEFEDAFASPAQRRANSAKRVASANRGGLFNLTLPLSSSGSSAASSPLALALNMTLSSSPGSTTVNSPHPSGWRSPAAKSFALAAEKFAAALAAATANSSPQPSSARSISSTTASPASTDLESSKKSRDGTYLSLDHRPTALSNLHDQEPADVATPDVHTPPQKLSPRTTLTPSKTELVPAIDLNSRIQPPAGSLALRPMTTVDGGVEGEQVLPVKRRTLSLLQPSSMFARTSTSPARTLAGTGIGGGAVGITSASRTSRSRSRSKGRSHSLSASMGSLALSSATQPPSSPAAVAAASYAASELLRARRAALARQSVPYTPRIEGTRLMQPSWNQRKQMEEQAQAMELATHIANAMAMKKAAMDTANTTASASPDAVPSSPCAGK